MPKAPKTKKEDTNKTTLFPVLKQKNFLELTEVEPDQIYVINKFFTEKECQSVIAFFETNLPPKESLGGKPKKGYAFRNNDRQALEDPKIAQLLWQGMEQIVLDSPMAQWNRTPKGLNSNIRVYRYRKGHSFASHYDESVQDKTTGLWTDWTLLIYLNEDMEGGETVFYRESSPNNRKPDPIVIKPKKGMALFHRHGTHCLLHEAMEVVNGNKWVLRSDVLIG
ncbi:uncharacterized protein B0P05DRAFT_501584 [Gilbertella persicaria]|uniref:Fe2OG dioxygenase domain-containing protein n=1 Tax=Rhizopus stolonifer TaxID=4846 RepID=A0A367IL97_RHIST|nr:uncharacterized protein B0P05DRAFT_501584 [Gilbertella persicaria]KAI8098160.1 hypothetical protein B0P05DRAFT_501584 [Gilbertella persicaria]RCH78457.1 hypothetical protein CU098_006421 [Rhizopus stolonifer]